MPAWGFHSQVFFLARRLQHHHQLVRYNGNAVQDRSVYEDAEIFARNLYLQGRMTERDYATYQNLYEGILPFLPPPDLIIYLAATVDTLQERIAQRNRAIEASIEVEYLARLNQLYETWASRWTLCPLLRVNANQHNFETDDAALQQLIQQI
jgi:deoxyadenosine/deoxycytidine kinase